MDLKVENQIPFLDFTKDPLDKEGRSDGWKSLCQQVRDACEGYGCFQVAYDKVPVQLREEMFMALKDLFDLPDETKKHHSISLPSDSYFNLTESFNVVDAFTLDNARAFTNLLWPQGNPGFCQTLNSMSRKLLELELIIQKMIYESFGVEKYYDSNVADNRTALRLLKYKAPPSNEPIVGSAPHTDTSFLTILCQGAEGLEVLSKQGDWFQVMPSEGTFTVFVGDGLKAWSNGRFQAAKHRVMMRGDRERYSYGLFTLPKEVSVPEELVDKEHPLLYRPFNFMEFISYFHSNVNKDNLLQIYAGI